MSKKITFNKYDVVIILLVIACVLGIIFRGAVSNSVTGTVYNDDAKIYFEIEEADESILSSIRAGDKFRFSNGALFGTLMEGYTYENSKKYVTNERGVTEHTLLAEKYDIKGYFTSVGRFTDSGFLSSGTKIFVNSYFEINSKNTVCTVKITKIENISKANSVQ